MQTLINCSACSQHKPHHARGYCTHCYHKFVVRGTGDFDRDTVKQKISITQKQRRNQEITINSQLSASQLKDLYCVQKMSMEDIAQIHNCSRMYVFLLLKKYNLPIRTKSAARAEAKKQGKNVGFSSINENFFKNQTPEMAYVLGFIYSDGNIGNLLDHFSISQKDPEILYKIKELISAEHSIPRRKNQEIYTLTIGNKVMINDLLSLGLTPNKSLDVKFPILDQSLYSHFIRGYFDGDGSIYFSRIWELSFTSGSKEFLESLEKCICKHANTSKRPISKHPLSRAHRLCYCRIHDLFKIFGYFYDSNSTNKSLMLNRKYEIFKKCIEQRREMVAKNVLKGDRRYKT